MVEKSNNRNQLFFFNFNIKKLVYNSNDLALLLIKNTEKRKEKNVLINSFY